MAKQGASRFGKWILIILVLVAAGAGAAYYLHGRNESPVEYQTGPVTRGNLTQAVTATGQLNPVVNVQVGSQISGRILRIYVDYNSQVKSNQVIAEIDPSTYKVAVMRAEAQLANAKANEALAEVQSRRAESLFKNNLIPAADHDTAVAQLQQAKADVLSAEANLENARVDLSRCTIYAPVDGVVISRNVDVGQTVAASFNTPTLFLIANDLTKMQIDALVSEADIGGVAVGQNVNFTVDAYPYQVFRGKVTQMRFGAVTNQNVVNYDCVVGVNNDDQKLLPGMTANVSIITAERDNVLRVPNAALRFRPPDIVAAEAKTNTMARPQAQSGRPEGAPGGGAGGAGQGMRQGRGVGQGDGGRGGGPAGGPGMRAGSDRGGPGMGGAAMGSRPRPERQASRTVYVLEGGPKGQLKPVQVKTGITDGLMTEVVEGLEDGAVVATGIISAAETSRPGANPFGGGGFRRF